MYVCIYTTYTIHGSHHVTFSHSRVPTSPCYGGGGGGGDISCCSASLPVSTTEPQESSEAEPNSSPRVAATGGKYGKDGILMDLG